MFFLIACSEIKKKENVQEYPLLNGAIDVDFSSRSMKADVCLIHNETLKNKSVYLSSDYHVYQIYNKSNEIKFIKKDLGKISRYNLLNVKDNQSICLKYKSIDIKNKREDFKGANPLTHRFMRGTEQSAWYPFLFSSKRKVNQTDFYKEGRLAFNLEISSDERSFFYLNGHKPQIGQKVRFNSYKKNTPLIYTAKNNSHNRDGWVIGEKTTEKFKSYIEDLLEDVVLKYNDWSNNEVNMIRPKILVFRSTEKKKDWSFVAYPTIAITNFSVKQITKKIDSENEKWGERFIAHEVAHHIFGERLKPTGIEFWFLLESIPEYFALRYLRQVNKKRYEKTLKSYKEKSLKSLKSLGQLTGDGSKEFNEFNRYIAGPSMLIKLEKVLGENITKEVIRKLMTLKDQKWSYIKFKKLINSIKGVDNTFNEFEKMCFLTRPQKECF